MTGCYPSRIGQFGVLTTFSPPIIPRERLTVASLLKQHGYHTCCVGKWHLGMTWDSSLKKKESDAAPIGSRATDGPTAIGFDLFAGYTHARNIGMIVEQDTVTAQVTEVETQPLLAKKAVDYIDSRAKAGGPFFLYFPLTSPHYPVVPAPEFKGKSSAGDFGDFVFQSDWTVGQVLDALQRSGVADNTLVLFTSDNGPEISNEVHPGVYDRIQQYSHASMGALRGAKRELWEGGHRVPFLARWPDKIKAGSTSDETICHVDLMATVAAVLKTKLPDDAGVDSFNVLPVLLGEEFK